MNKEERLRESLKDLTRDQVEAIVEVVLDAIFESPTEKVEAPMSVWFGTESDKERTTRSESFW